MLDTTVTCFKQLLSADSTVDPAERRRLLGLLAKDSDAIQKTRERIVRRAEAAERLGVSLRTIDNLARQGALTRIRLPGRKRGAGFRETDVVALMDGKIYR